MSAASLSLAPTEAPDSNRKCRLCTCKLGAEQDDDVENGLCCSCKGRPEAKRLGLQAAVLIGNGQRASHQAEARAFTPAEVSLIRKVHGFMPLPQLLNILNERLACDLGPDAAIHSMDELHSEIASIPGANLENGRDWASLRQILHKAKRSGLLASITEQMIDDFAVVFSLNAKQVVGLKDIILQTREEE